MKTLKQLREEYNGRYMSQVDNLPEEMMLEDIKTKNVIPSAREMPSLLVFRRVSFRSYPKGNVVALYYSKMLDKYLSIPFGPSGNLNLSEAVIHDTLDETLGSSATRYTERPTYEEKIDKLRKAKMEEGIGGAVTGAIGGYLKGGIKGALKGGVKGLLGVGDKGDDSKSDTFSDEPSVKLHNQPLQKTQAKAKTGSSWKAAQHQDPVFASREKQRTLAKENKITDIRDMIKEGVDNMDLSINGRQVTLNTTMAKRILEVYDSVNTKNKKIVEGMLNEDLESFKKLLNFSIRK